MENNWIVITGGPSVGKTSVINEIARRGHKIIHESAREVIDEALANGKSVDDLRGDALAFQVAIFHRTMKNQNGLDAKEFVFFDRGLHDIAGYQKFLGIPAVEQILEAMRKSSYRKVFILDPLPNFQKDYARTESPQEAALIHSHIADAYREHGIELVAVPVMAVGDRVDFILENI